MNKHRGADALVYTLQRAGIDTIYALSGNHIMPLFDALFESGIRLIHTRHEAACVHMADAHARLTGKPGVALVTGGPGHANAVGALYTAQMSESPVLLLSGHAPNDQLGMGAFQEMRQAEMAAPVTKLSFTAASAASLAADVTRALHTAKTGRPGPVHLSLPTDALESLIDASPQSLGASASTGSQAPAAAHTKALGAADAVRSLAWLAAGARPLVLAGPCMLTPGGRARLLALEDACGIPVIGMESPRGVNDPALGAFAQMLGEADRVLLVGKKVDFTLKFGKAFSASCVCMQIDAEEVERERARRALGTRLTASMEAEAAAAIAALTDQAQSVLTAATGTHRDWREKITAALQHRPAAWISARAPLPERLRPVEACRPLQAVLDSDAEAVLISDGGEFGQWAQACLSAPQRIINGPAGAIGAGLPFAIGARAALGIRDVPVLAFMGDGTFGFHVAEFDTAVRHKLPFVAIVGNDARWNAEYQIQLKTYGKARLHGCELLPARYDQVAAAFGGHGEFVTEAAQLLPAVERALASGKPACVNVMIEGAPAPLVTHG